MFINGYHYCNKHNCRLQISYRISDNKPFLRCPKSKNYKDCVTVDIKDKSFDLSGYELYISEQESNIAYDLKAMIDDDECDYPNLDSSY
ncbi:MAG: hypothetical protein IJE43_22245 [Alphaproteobacteria bacterium]|nr:hypothetical protein [Alphaproteobacteria bacterium]MBQ6887682.1 hypothetical protein [Lachnospiraceae bacterium]